jgi:hypothetical protein
MACIPGPKLRTTFAQNQAVSQHEIALILLGFVPFDRQTKDGAYGKAFGRTIDHCNSHPPMQKRGGNDSS